MAEAVMGKQLIITVNNEVGALAEVSSVLAGAGINVIAVCAYAVENKGVIMFVSEDNARAEQLLKAKKYDVREEEVIMLSLPNKPGSLQAVTEKIADASIDLTLLYGSVAEKGKLSRLVMISEDNNAVMMALQG